MTVPLAALAAVMFTADAVPVYWLLEMVLSAVPLGSGELELESGNGGAEDVSGDEDDEKTGAPVPPGDVTLAPDIGTVGFGIGNGGDTGPDV